MKKLGLNTNATVYRSMMVAKLNDMMDLTSRKTNLVFLLVMIGGSVIILSSFYLIDVNALLDKEFLTIKEKIMGIGVFIVIAHILLTYLAKMVFNKLRHAKSIISQQNDELATIDRAKTEFVSMITHELKTPIVPIVAYSKMLLNEKFGNLTDIQKEKLRIIISSSESLQLLIQDILDLHKADLGKLKLTMKYTDLQEIIQESIATTIPLANRRGIIIENMALEDCKLLVDKHRMVQVITNLIKNAIDFVPLERGVIKIQQKIQNTNVILSVTDNGQGIPKEKLSGLFKKFYQIEASTIGGRDSTGLGLSICKIIIEQHGGMIWAESEIGIGTSMKISLPLAKTSDIDKIQPMPLHSN